MSTIPPNWIGSVVGSNSASGRAADAKSKENADQAKTVDNSAFSERLQDVIESTDTDTQVHPDAEGLGSQGRPFGDGAEPEPPEEEKTPEATEESLGNLDVEA
ncbi:MAG: hypothetical protein JXO22_17450 [Phycisphaerae bacterium]|nr:hypothetical protein [Phycisphaerae bacterium]